MKQKMDKLKSKIKTNKKFTIFLLVLVLIGVITGAFFITILSSSDKTLVKEYLNNYINVIKVEKIDYISLLINNALNSTLLALTIWLLGISIIGIPIMLFLFFCKAFTLGFSIGTLFFTYNWKGIIMALVYVFPHQIIAILSYTILMIYALSVSLKMIEATFKKKTIDFKTIMGKYSVVLGIVLVSLLLCTLYETLAMPNIMKMITQIIK